MLMLSVFVLFVADLHFFLTNIKKNGYIRIQFKTDNYQNKQFHQILIVISFFFIFENKRMEMSGSAHNSHISERQLWNQFSYTKSR